MSPNDSNSHHLFSHGGRIIRNVASALLLALVGLLSHRTGFAQVTLQTGESFTFDFTLAYEHPADSVYYSSVVYLSGGQVGRNWTTLIEYFPNTVSDPPFFTTTYTHIGPVPPFDSVGLSASFNPELPSPWPDLQGVVRVTSVNGQFNVNSLWVNEGINGQYFSKIVQAPEPAPIAFILAATACLWVSRKRGFRLPVFS